MSSLVYGGNKIRKLEFILGQARKRNAAHVITFGGIGTNHGLATAVFCEKLGISVHPAAVLAAGDPGRETESASV